MEAPYDRAVTLAKARPSLSVTNLKSLGFTEAQARSFMRVMVADRILSEEPNAVGRHVVLAYSGTDIEGQALVDLDNPQLSQLPALVVADQVLDARGQAELKKIVGAFIDIESRKATLRDEASALRALAKIANISPKIAEKVARALYKDKKAELINAINLTELYLHALGEMVDGAASEPGTEVTI